MLTFFRSKTAIRLAAISLLLLSCASLFWSFTNVVSISLPSTSSASEKAASTETGNESGQACDLSELWTQLFVCRFQQPLFDPPPKPPEPIVKKEIPPPPIRVLSTMVEPSGGFTTIVDDQGNTCVHSVGATISAGGTTAKLLKIEQAAIQLEHEGRIVTMQLHVN